MAHPLAGKWRAEPSSARRIALTLAGAYFLAVAVLVVVQFWNARTVSQDDSALDVQAWLWALNGPAFFSWLFAGPVSGMLLGGQEVFVGVVFVCWMLAGAALNAALVVPVTLASARLIRAPLRLVRRNRSARRT
jgi:hypothetical protein